MLASDQDGKVNLIVMATDEAQRQGAHAGNLIKAIAAKVGGGGGGKPGMAQAGGKNPAGIADALIALLGTGSAVVAASLHLCRPVAIHAAFHAQAAYNTEVPTLVSVVVELQVTLYEIGLVRHRIHVEAAIVTDQPVGTIDARI